MPSSDRSFLIGTDVRLACSVSRLQGGAPEDAVLRVEQIRQQGGSPVGLLSGGQMTKTGSGEYVYVLSTAGMTQGTYTWRVRAESADGVTLSEDTFVLSLPS